jgi:hypothetical protein
MWGKQYALEAESFWTGTGTAWSKRQAGAGDQVCVQSHVGCPKSMVQPDFDVQPAELRLLNTLRPHSITGHSAHDHRY